MIAPASSGDAEIAPVVGRHQSARGVPLDDDDHRGADGLAGQAGHLPDGAAADDGDGLARHHPTALGGREPAGQRVAHEDRGLRAAVLGNPAEDRIGVWHPDRLGLRPRQRRAEDRPEAEEAAIVAFPVIAVPAPPAPPAGREIARNDLLADPAVLHGGADGDDLADELMTQHRAGGNPGNAVQGMEVGSADSADPDGHEGVGGLLDPRLRDVGECDLAG